MDQIARLMIALRQPHPKCGYAQMALCRAGGHGGGEIITRHTGPRGEVTRQRRIPCFRRHIAPRIFNQRNKIIGRVPKPSILEIEQTRALRPRAPIKAHQIGREVIAMHKAARAGKGAEHGVQRGSKPSAQIVTWRCAHSSRPPPIKKGRCRRPRHGRSIPGGQAGRWGGFMQRGQGLGGFGVKRWRIRPAIQQRGMGGVAEIFQQHQALIRIGGDDLRRGKPKAPDMAGNGDEGAGIFRRRRFHQQRRARPTQQAGIAPRRSVRGQAV